MDIPSKGERKCRQPSEAEHDKLKVRVEEREKIIEAVGKIIVWMPARILGQVTVKRAILFLSKQIGS